MVAEYYESSRPSRPRNEVILEAVRKTSPPIFITALTTVLGFLSLGINRIVSIREMGLYSSVGITIAFVLSVVLVPACLALLRLPTRQEDTFSPAVSVALQGLGRRDIRYRRAIILAGMVIVVVSAWQIPTIQVDSNFQSFFRAESPVRQANEAINRHLAGGMAFYVVLESSQTDIMKQWDTLRRMKDLQLYIDSLPGIEKTVSLVDYCELLDKGIQAIPGEDGTSAAPSPQGQTTFWDNPAQLEGVIQLLFAGSISGVVNHPKYSHANILVRTSLARASDIADTVKKIQVFAQQTFPPEFRVRPTGTLLLLTRTTDDIVTGQVQSLALAAGVIFVVMSALFLSVRQGELGNEMYVLLKGTADVVINNAPGQSRQVGTLGRGEVFGEMGLIRRHERTADVVAREDVEVLAVNERFLARMKRRYPRIATEIFFNISRILSDRLEKSQQPGR